MFLARTVLHSANSRISATTAPTVISPVVELVVALVAQAAGGWTTIMIQTSETGISTFQPSAMNWS